MKKGGSNEVAKWQASFSESKGKMRGISDAL